jgi:hypothetical protein
LVRRELELIQSATTVSASARDRVREHVCKVYQYYRHRSVVRVLRRAERLDRGGGVETWGGFWGGAVRPAALGTLL